MTADLAHAGGPVAAAGLALVIVAPRRDLRLAGLGGWLLGCVFLAAYLAPGGHTKVYAAAVVVGAIGAVAIAALFRRWPWLIAVSALACVPARIPVHVGATDANLLVPLYVVIAGAAVLLGWELVRGDDRTRELGPLAWPLALLVAWTGLVCCGRRTCTRARSRCSSSGSRSACSPLSIARLAWNRRWLSVLYVQLVGMALAFACDRRLPVRDARRVLEPEGDRRRTPTRRSTASTRSSTTPPSTDGSSSSRSLAALVLAVYDRDRRAAYASAAAVVADLARAALLVLAVELRRADRRGGGRRRAFAGGGGRRSRSVSLPAVIAAVALGTPHIRHSLLRESGSGLNQATSGRAKLVTHGIRIALAPPGRGRRASAASSARTPTASG